jgi:hypothetical protein
LGQLEDSLTASQEALLARDLGGLERWTREQIRLRRALEILWAGKDPQGVLTAANNFAASFNNTANNLTQQQGSR